VNQAFIRNLVPRRLRQWWQRRKLSSLVAGYPRRVVEHRYGEVLLKVELADPLAEGWYDHDWTPLPEMILLGRSRLQPGARVLDVGAHQGVVGLMIGRQVGPTGEVVLVEPNRHNAALCERNAALNGMPWVRLHRAAISDREGTISFNGGLNGQAGELSDYGGLEEVPAITLDALVARYGPPDVIFLDVEGFEGRALASAGQAFAAHPDWMVEVHVGCGLEAAGGSVEQVLAHFPPQRFTRHIHSDGETAPIPLEACPPAKLRDRFFLTAVAR
jgi:FkbM family methyltransferase